PSCWLGAGDAKGEGLKGSRYTAGGLCVAREVNLKSFMLLAAGGRAVKAWDVSPPMVDVIAGAAPVNGTMVRSSPNSSLNSSPLRCGVEPVAGWAKLNLPGLARTSAIRSCTLFAGTAGLTVSTLGDAATSVTGAKSFTGS